MDKPSLSISKVYHSRLKTRNIDNSIISKLLNDTNSDQYEAGESDETVEYFEYLSTSSSKELVPAQPQKQTG
jgi:hypothetical protein